ncbi:MAG: Sec-independent protein translocase subunit TatA [Actinomycetota bacterium]|nr:Sec-independent protein translocase subunit TatA [Actinomycetota bacterium]
MNLPGGWELVLVLLVVLLIFGSKRLPDSARALGRSLRIFKAETKGLRSDAEEQPRFDPYTGKPIEPPAGSDTPS